MKKVKLLPAAKKAMAQNRLFDAYAYIDRLIMLRQLLGGLNQTEMARVLGITLKRWNNYERGYPISLDTAMQIHATIPGMSTDWIWFGMVGNLSETYRRQILNLERDLIRARKRAPA